MAAISRLQLMYIPIIYNTKSTEDQRSSYVGLTLQGINIQECVQEMIGQKVTKAELRLFASTTHFLSFLVYFKLLL